jgi:hypothetical protein
MAEACDYLGYGLRIRSAIPLPELNALPSGESPDVFLQLGLVAEPAGLPNERYARFHGDEIELGWQRFGRFRVRRREITLEPMTEDARALRFAILGPVLAAVLQLRGHPLLHGSGVVRDGRALIIIGPKGAGKSSLAAAFGAIGLSAVNDDVLPLSLAPQGVMLTGGFPALKLYPSVREAVVPHWPDAESSHGEGKAFVVDPRRDGGAWPVAGVIILDGGQCAEPIDPRRALSAILEHGYALKFGADALAFGQGESLFSVAARLSHSVTIVRASLPKGLDDASAFARKLADALIPPGGAQAAVRSRGRASSAVPG